MKSALLLSIFIAFCAIYLIHNSYKTYITSSLQAGNQLVSPALKMRSTYPSNAPVEIDPICWFQRAFTDKVEALLEKKGLKLDYKGLQMPAEPSSTRIFTYTKTGFGSVFGLQRKMKNENQTLSSQYEDKAS